MSVIQTLAQASQKILFILLGLMGLFALIVFGWQIMILKGKATENPDGTVDDWHEQKNHYGIALADVFLACPACIVGIILVFVSPRWGFYLLALASFWFLWANIMTTATSLRFKKPKLTLNWWISFPTGGLVGLVYIGWTIIHFDMIYF